MSTNQLCAAYLSCIVESNTAAPWFKGFGRMVINEWHALLDHGFERKKNIHEIPAGNRLVLATMAWKLGLNGWNLGGGSGKHGKNGAHLIEIRHPSMHCHCEAIVKVHGVLPSSRWYLRIFTDTSSSLSPCRRQRGSRYTIRAGRYLCDKEFRYLRTVRVTAAVYRGLRSGRGMQSSMSISDHCFRAASPGE